MLIDLSTLTPLKKVLAAGDADDDAADDDADADDDEASERDDKTGCCKLKRARERSLVCHIEYL